MKRLLLTTALILASTQAQAALKVTNLSYEPKTVMFEAAGSVTEHVIGARRTTFITGGDGLISLKGAAPTASDSQIIGTRSDVFGLVKSGRTRGIPASQMDTFVIWPDGRLMFQKRTAGGRTGR